MIADQCRSSLCLLTSIKCFINGGRVQIPALYVVFFLVSAALNLFSFYCGDFGSLECAASPALCGLSWLQACPSAFPVVGWPWIFHHVALLSPGQLEQIPLLFSLCYTLLPCQWMTWWLVSLVPGCPRREHHVVKHCNFPTAAFILPNKKPVWGCHADGL